MKAVLPSDNEVMPNLNDDKEVKKLEIEDVPKGEPVEAGQPAEEGVIKWVFDPENIFQRFELYLRGYYFDSISGELKRVYRTYVDERTGEEYKVPVAIANEEGVNDIMSTLIFNVNRVFSFTIRKEEDIKLELARLSFDLHERYIIKFQRQFEINPANGYKIVNDMYNIILSAWSQSIGGKGMGLIGTTVNVNESTGGRQQESSRPFWRIPLIGRRR